MEGVRMRHKLNRTTVPHYPIRIEYQDDKYTYISGFYSYKELKEDIENVKRPILIHFSADAKFY